MTTITTPSGISVIIDRGTIFKTSKGRYIIVDLVHDEQGNIQAVKFVPINDMQQVGINDLENHVQKETVQL